MCDMTHSYAWHDMTHACVWRDSKGLFECDAAAVGCSVLRCVAVCWQCVAVCCSMLQCVAVCCSVLQCVAFIGAKALFLCHDLVERDTLLECEALLEWKNTPTHMITNYRSLLEESPIKETAFPCVILVPKLFQTKSIPFGIQCPCTGWRRLIGSPKLQIIFHKRATNYRSLLRKMTYEDKGSYASSPPCTMQCPFGMRCPCRNAMPFM